MKNYDPKNWYWYVGGDKTKVYSSSVGDYVPTSDANFTKWSEDSVPTNIDTEANLGQVLAPYFQRPTNPSVLDSYQSSQADDALSQLLFKLIFNHENRLNAIEGKPNITAAQAKAFVKARM